MQFLEKALYGLPPLSRTRTKPMQVLALGLSRSGTESLREALVQLGYDHVHHGYDAAVLQPIAFQAWTELYRRKWGAYDDGDCKITAEEFDAIIGDCEAVTDTPCALFAQELVVAYPNSMVIINRRDAGSWYESFTNTFIPWHYGPVGWTAWARSWFCAELYWLQRCNEWHIEAFFYGSFRNTGKWVYRQHVAMIRGLVPSERLLEWSVEDGWEPLCQFLDRGVPKTEFPKGNAPAEFEAKVGRILKDWNDRATQRMKVVGAVLIAVLAGLIFRINQ